MSGGVWINPVDVGVEAVPTTLLTNIADNLRCLHKGNGHASLQTITPSSNKSINIGADDQTFFVNDDYSIDYISTTGRQVGNVIHLIMVGSSGNIGYDQSTPPAGTAKIYGNGAGATSNTWNQYRLITLVYSGLAWHHDMTFS